MAYYRCAQMSLQFFPGGAAAVDMRNKNYNYSRCQLSMAVLLLLSLLFSLQPTFTIAFCQRQHYIIVSRIGIRSSPAFIMKKRVLHMGLYEEDIDWDSDLFGQLSNIRKNYNLPPSNNSSTSNDTLLSSGSSVDDGQWDMGQANKSTMMTMREQMKRQMGEKGANNSSERKKPDVGWVPNYGKVIDEDEPWFTG